MGSQTQTAFSVIVPQEVLLQTLDIQTLDTIKPRHNYHKI